MLRFLLLLSCCLSACWARAQVPSFTLEQCVNYALDNRPSLRDARLTDSVAVLNNQIALAAWRPFLLLDGSLRNNVIQQVSIFPDFENPGQTREVTIGTAWTSAAGLTAQQLIYSPLVARDARLRTPLVERAVLDIEAAEIEAIAAVERAFYRNLRSLEEIELVRANLERLDRALRDARLLYEEGLNDKVDYLRATVAQNRARLDLQQAGYALATSRAELKRQMGYPPEEELSLDYNFDVYVNRVLTDSLADLNPRERVELRALRADRVVQELFLLGARRSWLPEISAQANYTYNWLAQNFGSLYDRSFPASFLGLNVSAPLFSGGRRFRRVELETLRRDRLDFQVLDLSDQIELEYQSATNNYLSARAAYLLARENTDLTREIYDVVLLQYREGIEPFLEVVIAENDLQVAQINALNGLIDAMIARTDLRLAAGEIDARYER